jgi:hypothetical protein
MVVIQHEDDRKELMLLRPGEVRPGLGLGRERIEADTYATLTRYCTSAIECLTTGRSPNSCDLAAMKLVADQP